MDNNTRNTRFGQKPQSQSQPQPPQDDAPPFWESIPDDAYMSEGSPVRDDNGDDRDFTAESYGFSQEPEAAPMAESKLRYLQPNESPEILAYDRIVPEFNKAISFGSGKHNANSQKEIINSMQQRVQQPPAQQREAQAQQPAQQREPQQPVQQRAPQAQQPVQEREPQQPAQQREPEQARARPSNMNNNIAFLDTTPLLVVMEHFANFFSQQMPVKHLYNNVFDMNGYRISVNNQENKWYNIDTKRGNSNALSLAREIIAIHDDVDLSNKENFSKVAAASVREVGKIQRNLEKYTNIDDLIKFTLPKEQKAKAEPVNKDEAPKNENSNSNNNSKDDINWQEMREFLNNIPLSDIAEMLGATPGEDGQDNLWKMHCTGHNIAINGQQFKNWNIGEKGSWGAIAFMKQHISITEGISMSEDKALYSKAINFLRKEFGDADIEIGENGATFKSLFNFPHVLPGKTHEIKEYLHEKRGLPKWLINKQISNGVLFAGYPSDWKTPKLLRESEKMSNDDVWATFLSPNGDAAEMRGIGNNYILKLLAKGSEKSSGGYVVPAEAKYNEGILAICEASVDATTYAALYPGRSATSVMGVNVDLAVELTFEAADKGLKTYISFDNDFAGNSATYQYHQRMIQEVENEEDYQEFLDTDQVRYFELGIQIFKEHLAKGIPYYFDMKSNEDGINTANLFWKTLLREFPKEELNNHLIKGRLKVNNICPNWAEIRDPDLEAKAAVETLKTKSRYYYYPDAIKPLDENVRLTQEQREVREKNHLINIEKREKFIAAFEKYAGPENLMIWKKDRRIATNETINNLSKDWNEWMNYRLENHKELVREFADREVEFKHYENAVIKMKKTDLANHDKIKKNNKP